MSNRCALCSLTLPKNPLLENGNAFCCSGCLTVFTLVGALENYQTHPLFQEALKAGVISNPALFEKTQEEIPSETIKFHLEIEGMWCPSCAEAIRLILLRQQGVLSCVVDYATDLAVITVNPRKVSKEELFGLIKRLGYQPSELMGSEKSAFSRRLWLRFGIAVFCAMNIMMFSYPLYASHFGAEAEGYESALGWLSFALSLPLITYCAWPIWKRLGVSFRSGFFGMETLVLTGVSTACIVSTLALLKGEPTSLYFDSMSMVITFVLLGKILEKKAKFSAKQTLFRLTRSLPKKGNKRLENGEFAYVPLKEIGCGDVLRVRSGEKIILDGIVEEGSGLVDEAVMTGEAMPLLKRSGQQVMGGSNVKQGALIYKVTKSVEQSLIGQIISVIEKDLETKNLQDRLVDKLSAFFVPIALVLAAFSYFLGGPHRALTVLLISCPCALGIAAPLACSRLLFHFAEKGALVRNRSRLWFLAKKPFFVFDKTGTLTDGKFQVLAGLEGLSQKEEGILKGLALQSTHPAALAISEVIGTHAHELKEVCEIIGRGIQASFGEEAYFLGSKRFMEESCGISMTASEATTQVYFASSKEILAKITLGDRLRLRLPKVEGGILSGDTPALVENVAFQCGFVWGKGGMDPLQKRWEILKLKETGRPIVMVGDGVNDAPAMSAADVGISVVSATDLAVEVSDILLTTKHLDALPELCSLVEKCRRLIHQNLFWAFFYNCIGMGLAFFGLLNPFLAASAMLISSLFVTLNSYRL